MDCQETRPSSKLTTCSFLLLVLSSLLCSIFLTVDKKKVRFEGAAEIYADVPLLLSDFCSFSLLSGLRVEFVVWSLQASHSWEHSSPTYLHFESNCPFAARWTLIKKHLTFFFLATFLHLYNAQCFFCPVSQSCCDLGKGHTCQSWKKATRLHLYNRHFQSDLPIS